MPWQTPTLKAVRIMTRDNVTALLRGAAMVPNNVLRIMADAMAALAALTLEYIHWLSEQLLPDTAETEWLDRHGQIWLVNSDGSKGRKGPTLASGAITLTGIFGQIIPIGSRLTGATPGLASVAYETLNQVVIDQDGQATVNVRAIFPGKAGNLDPGIGMTFTPAITNVNTSASVITMTGGAEQETDTELRTRILYRIQHPPMGGDATDYVQWTLAVPGTSRAWSFPNEMGAGTCTVRFMMDELRASNNGFPTGDDINAVRAYLDTVRPVAVKDFFVEAPIPFPINFTLNNLDSGDAGTQGNILASLQAAFLQRATPGQTWFRAWTDAAISTALGVNFYDILSPAGDILMPSPGYMPTLGTITYQNV